MTETPTAPRVFYLDALRNAEATMLDMRARRDDAPPALLAQVTAWLQAHAYCEVPLALKPDGPVPLPAEASMLDRVFFRHQPETTRMMDAGDVVALGDEVWLARCTGWARLPDVRPDDIVCERWEWYGIPARVAGTWLPLHECAPEGRLALSISDGTPYELFVNVGADA